MYGVTKVAGELLCDYYYKRFGVDTRGLRYPGIISHETLPGGGTTDYAVEIYYEAIKEKKYTCFLAEGTCLDMMYMPDAIKAAIDLMEADPAKLKHRNAFNVTAMSFDAGGDLAAEIKKHIPDFDDRLRGRSRPPGHRRLLAEHHGRHRRPRGVGLEARSILCAPWPKT